MSFYFAGAVWRIYGGRGGREVPVEPSAISAPDGIPDIWQMVDGGANSYRFWRSCPLEFEVAEEIRLSAVWWNAGLAIK